MPVVNGEVCYEALLDRIPAEVVRLMFWADVLSGAAGHTYGANGIWQLNRKDRPYGKSPHGGDYGHIPWDEAMKLPGSGQLGQAKRLLETYPWHRFEPHPEWATWNETKGVERDPFRVPYAAGVPGADPHRLPTGPPGGHHPQAGAEQIIRCQLLRPGFGAA